MKHAKRKGKHKKTRRDISTGWNSGEKTTFSSLSQGHRLLSFPSFSSSFAVCTRELSRDRQGCRPQPNVRATEVFRFVPHESARFAYESMQRGPLGFYRLSFLNLQVTTTMKMIHLIPMSISRKGIINHLPIFARGGFGFSNLRGCLQKSLHSRLSGAENEGRSP